jgi:pimeloyl-ACP methyl ester carboxylesterase
MDMNRRSFMASVGGAATISWIDVVPRAEALAQTSAPQNSNAPFDVHALRDRLNADGEFLLKARYWDARLRLEIDDHRFNVVVRAGRVADFAPLITGGPIDVRISGPATAWREGFVARGLTVEGDQLVHVAPYRGAILRLIAVVREASGSRVQEAAIPNVDRKFDAAVGRYVYVTIQDVQYRVYFEEAGQGIPIVLQHTAGSDGRQWRHMLEDTELQKRFRMVAYDLPFHGKSVPPVGVRWWEREYRLTTELVMDSVVAIARGLNLERPIYMGCSVGGYLAPDLALYRPDDFRAVIGVNSAIAGGQAPSQNPGAKAEAQLPISDRPPNSRYHPRVSGETIGISMYEITSPEAPDAYRRETAWVYSQGGPGIFAGDLYYYSLDHDLVGKVHQINTSKVDVHLLSGEYDPTARPGPQSAQALSAQIPGSTYAVIKGGSHFAMSDDYPRFRQALLPILDRLYAKHASTTRRSGAA